MISFSITILSLKIAISAFAENIFFSEIFRIKASIRSLLELTTERASNLWIDIESYARKTGFFIENAEVLLERVRGASSNKSDWILDYFLGSGKTTAVAHKLDRKWIGVEKRVNI